MRQDADIQTDVYSELSWAPEIHATAIDVTVMKGVVTLAGHVPSYLDKLTAVQATERVADVVGIKDSVTVKLPPGSKVSDAVLAARIADVIAWTAAAPDGAITARVVNGNAILTGTVDFYHQRHNVHELVARLTGVVSLRNVIVVRPDAYPQEIRHQITKALERRAAAKAEKIAGAISGKTNKMIAQIICLHRLPARKRRVRAKPGTVEYGYFQ